MSKFKKREGDKHHYIPKFYLKQWVGPDGQLCEFSRPYEIKEGQPARSFIPVRTRRVSPDATGYEYGLYTFNNLSPAAVNFIEHEFLMIADHGAYAILCKLLSNEITLSADDKTAWSRFMMTLFHRSPEGVARIKDRVMVDLPTELEKFRPQYDAMRTNREMPTFQAFCEGLSEKDFDAMHLQLLGRVMDSEVVGNALNSMIWGVIKIDRSRYPLITSDRPIIMSNGLGRPDAHIVMPISPDQAFVAVKNEETRVQIENDAKKGRFVERVNDLVVRQARKYVYGSDDRQRRFVENRLGEKRSWGPLE
jgi:Protein of unknown function (DUF4238)